ncbi:hypothetical protein [Pseudomonas sp. CP4]|uniref:hypothetical protein n=1 Tax=Pseudomonas sp. CP4 TaxID=3388844 RepID=UPI0039F0BAE5
MSNSTINSQTWLQNFRPSLNGVPVRWEDLRLNMAAGKSFELKLDFEYSYMIGDPDALLKLCCEPNQEQVGLMCDPPFEELVEMAEGLTSLTWRLSATPESTGSFELHYEMPKYDGMPFSPTIPGAVLNFMQELEIKFDEFSLNLGASAYPCHGAEHTFTVLPKPGSRLLNKNIQLMMTGTGLGVTVKPSLGSGQSLEPEGIKWILDCRSTSNNGEFFLGLAVDDWVSEPCQMFLAHNLVEAKHWRVEHAQWPEWTPYYVSHVRATSVYLKAPASRVQVIVNDGSDYGVTNSNGEYNEREAKLRIFNRYNNTTV